MVPDSQLCPLKQIQVDQRQVRVVLVVKIPIVLDK